jgi:hypothetical protein
MEQKYNSESLVSFLSVGPKHLKNLMTILSQINDYPEQNNI